MGFTDLFSDLLSTAFTTESMHAESPPAEEDTPSDEGEEGDEKEEGGDDDAEGGDDAGDSGNGGDDEEEEEQEEEEEEEPEDPKPKIEAECAQSAGCRPVKHHYDECVERVTSHEEDEGEHKGPKEDCVEEFFHLVHCANQCAAPKLFAQLK